MIENIILASLIITILSIAISFIRFLKGPTLLNRVVAFDTIGIIVVSLIIVIAMVLKRFIYVDVALVYGLLSFLGVLVIARTVERGL
ncbi:MAG: cation:proton antiporter [Deltaproteobacteria bacterium]|nr:cation:proton antiporter [Deltaproteobacteria bacterium]